MQLGLIHIQGTLSWLLGTVGEVTVKVDFKLKIFWFSDNRNSLRQASFHSSFFALYSEENSKEPCFTKLMQYLTKQSWTKRRMYGKNNYFWTWSSHSCRYKEFCLLGHTTVWSDETQPTFRRNMSPPSSVLKNNSSSMNQAASWFLAWLTLKPWIRMAL
jgi:hypothetical protein